MQPDSDISQQTGDPAPRRARRRRAPDARGSEELKNTLGGRIRELRRAQGRSQETLAAPEFTKSYISAVERNKVRPSLKALQLIAGRLGVPAGTLLADTPKLGPDPVVVLRSAEAALLAGETDRGLAILEQPLPEREAERYLLRARLLLEQNQFARAAEEIQQAIGGSPSAELATRAQDLHREVLARQGQAFEVLKHFQDRLTVDAAGDGIEEGQGSRAAGLRHAIGIFAAQGRLAELGSLMGQLQDQSDGLIAKREKQYALASLNLFEADDIQPAAVALAKAQALSALRQEVLLATELRLSGTAISSDQAEPEQAERLLVEARLLADLGGSRGEAARVVVKQAALSLAQGNLAKAAQYANEAMRLDSGSVAAIRAQMILGQIAAAGDVPKEADRELSAAVEAAEARKDKALISEVAATFAEVLAARGEHKMASHYYRLALVHGQHPL